MRLRIFAATCLLLFLAPPRAHAGAGEVAETLNIVWEALWQQQGYLQPVSKWLDPIRVSVSGAGAPARPRTSKSRSSPTT